MKIYISGIAGTGMGPLALMAKAAGCEVCGSDAAQGAITEELEQAKIKVVYGIQDGSFLRQCMDVGKIDWYCYTSALETDNPELLTAQELGLKCTKRDELIADLVKRLGLKMVAVAGTHGKTTTTSMIIWACLKLGIPAAYMVGTTLGFAKSGAYHKGDKYFIYEADEYDRNFLHFQPWLAVIPFVSYDHADIYPTPEDYKAAFEQFKQQSRQVIEMGEQMELAAEHKFKLAGEVRRQDAALAQWAIMKILEDAKMPIEEGAILENAEEELETRKKITSDRIIEILNDFPGVGRRFEKIADGVYSDYAHHPEEITATIEVALEESERLGLKGVVAIYEPHQNTRQHEVFEDYTEAFVGVERLFWLPTYLTRENPDLTVLNPYDFIETLVNAEVAEEAAPDDKLLSKIQQLKADGYLILLMTAGPADSWLRKALKKEEK